MSPMPDPCQDLLGLKMRNARAHRRVKLNPNDPTALAERDAASTELRTAKIAAAIAAEVDKAPPLTTEQRTRLAALLASGSSPGRDSAA